MMIKKKKKKHDILKVIAIAENLMTTYFAWYPCYPCSSVTLSMFMLYSLMHSTHSNKHLNKNYNPVHLHEKLNKNCQYIYIC